MGLTNADNAFTLYYVKFRAAAPKVKVSIILFEPTESTHRSFSVTIFFSFSL